MTVPSSGNVKQKQAEEVCPKCKGSGKIWTPCNKCRGTGSKDGEECPFCDGHGGHDDPCPNCQLQQLVGKETALSPKLARAAED